MPSVEVEPADAARIRHGQALPAVGSGLPDGGSVRVLLGGELVAVAFLEGNRLRPRKVMAHG
jgi:hypothetical protein